MNGIQKVLIALVFGMRRLKHFLLPHKKLIIRTLLALLFFFIIVYALFIEAPYNFPTKTIISVPEGSSLHETANILKEEKVIRSALWYKVFNVLSGNQTQIQAGDYYFKTRINLFKVTARIVTGQYDLTPVTVRISEGSTVFDIGEQLSSRLSRFDGDAFVERALKEEAEGYLFPDTYEFLPNVDEKKVFKVMRETFDKKVATITSQIKEFDQSFEDIIIMASIIEKESANDFEERQIISGILWNRISIGMALQVDAVFPYINGKNTYELSTDDLQVDSPYNTYKYPGLPIGPISNPSLDSILAAVTPIDTDYLFYLHDRDGNVYYSTNFESHKQNKFKYLR